MNCSFNHILLSVLVFVSFPSIAQNQKITNDQFWTTKNGEPIYSQGGGIFRFEHEESGEEKYYWYGVHYEEAQKYREDPSVTHSNNHFVAVTCYSSTDLVNWKFENNVLTRAEATKHEPTEWMGRMGVAYMKEADQYALFIQHNAGVLIALADSPTGTFKWHRKIDMTDRIGTPNTGDQTVFTDYDTGTSYLVYSYGRGRNKIYISEIGVKNGRVDLLDVNEIFRGKGREGNCMFKYKGRYYVFASNLYGWDSSYAYYLVSDNIKGPYEPVNKMLITPGSMNDYAHITQTGFFVNVKGSEQETVIYCGDRWAEFAGNGLGYNQWCPLSFDGETPYFNSLHAWYFNEKTGKWRVAEDNNYVKNSSFEADRRKIPSPVKPIQEHLKGWVTKVYQGNPVVIEDSASPELNYFNTHEDRQTVIGEKSLNIEDDIPFERKVYQQIESTPFVEMPDGSYTFQATIRVNDKFEQLTMYTESDGIKKELALHNQQSGWVFVTLPEIEVREGKVEVGFYAKGKAGASCQIDDVSVVMD